MNEWMKRKINVEIGDKQQATESRSRDEQLMLSNKNITKIYLRQWAVSIAFVRLCSQL